MHLIPLWLVILGTYLLYVIVFWICWFISGRTFQDAKDALK